ncbi:MAG TPA: hypothetical protein VF243_01635 [Nitrosospira sp.]
MTRPRKYPTGTPASVRVTASVHELKRRGGARKTWRLSPEAHDALKLILRLTQASTETSVIERLLMEEKRRLL